MKGDAESIFIVGMPFKDHFKPNETKT